MKDDVFAVIADPTRRHILQALAVERLAVGELVEELGVSQPTVSKHLKVLRTAGLVETEAVGQKRFYSITPAPLLAVTEWAEKLLEAPALHAGAPAPRSETAHPASRQGDIIPPASPETKVSSLQATSTSAETKEEPPMPAEVPENTVDTAVVPHPSNAGILITPLLPFTPVLDQYAGEKDSEIIDAEQIFLGHKAESTQALSVALDNRFDAKGSASATPLELKAMAQNLTLDSSESVVSTREDLVSQKVPSETELVAVGLESDIDAQAEAAVAESQERASITEAQANEAAEERGLLSKLARWSRRSAR